jgi:uncharacterized membrane protein
MPETEPTDGALGGIIADVLRVEKEVQTALRQTIRECEAALQESYDRVNTASHPAATAVPPATVSVTPVEATPEPEAPVPLAEDPAPAAEVPAPESAPEPVPTPDPALGPVS